MTKAVEEKDAEMCVRMGAHDTTYRGDVIPAARLMGFAADCSAQIFHRAYGEGGLLAAYESAKFMQVVRVGDYIAFHATVIARGKRSRKVRVSARRVARSDGVRDDADVAFGHESRTVLEATIISVLSPSSVQAAE